MAFVTIGHQAAAPHRAARWSRCSSAWPGSWSPGGRWPTPPQSYEAFLLIIAYWIGPWLGVVFADQYLRRGQTVAGFLYDRSYANWTGLLSFADRPGGVGAVVLEPGEVRRLRGARRTRSSATSRSSSASCSRPRSTWCCAGRRSPRSGVAVVDDAASRCSTSPSRRPEKAWRRAASRSAPRCSAADGVLLGSGHNRRVQDDDPSVHGETDAFRNAGRQRDYRVTVMVTTLSPCWYCSGLVRQFNIGAVVIGESQDVHRRARLAGRARRGESRCSTTSGA